MRARPRRRLNRRLQATAVAGGLLLASCGGDDDGVATGDTATVTSADTTAATTSPAVTTAPVTTTSAPATTPVPETTAPPTTEATTTTVAPAQPATALVASPTGIVRITGSGTSSIVTGEPAAIAVEVDQTVYFQAASGPSDDTPDASDTDRAATAIRWVDPGGTKTLLAPQEGQWLRLHDAGRSPAGDPVLLFSVYRGDGPPVDDNPDPATETLHLYDIRTASITDLGEIGGWEFGTSRLHLGGGLVGGTWYSEASHGLYLVGVDGTDRAEPARFGLEASYFDCGAECPNTFTVDDAGALLAWVDDGVATFADVASGAVLATLAVPGGVYTDAEIDGSTLLLARPDLPTLRVDIITGAVTELPAGTVTLV